MQETKEPVHKVENVGEDDLDFIEDFLALAEELSFPATGVVIQR